MPGFASFVAVIRCVVRAVALLSAGFSGNPAFRPFNPFIMKDNPSFARFRNNVDMAKNVLRSR